MNIVSQVEMGLWVSPSFSVVRLCLACCHSLCEFICTPGLLCLESNHPLCLALTILLSVLRRCLSLEERDVRMTSHLELRAPKSLPLCPLSSVGLCASYHLLTSPFRDGDCTTLWTLVVTKVISSHFIAFIRTTVGGFPLGPWPY